MLAMASGGEAPTAAQAESKPAPQLPNVSALTLQDGPAHSLVAPVGAPLTTPPQVAFPPITPALLAALQKDPAPYNAANKTSMAAYAPTNVRMLEMHILQQEQANRILYEHAMALSLQQRQEQQSKLLQEQQRIGQMRQLMQLRQQQRSSNNPTNNRASAA
jgi:hypothetical protein